MVRGQLKIISYIEKELSLPVAIKEIVTRAKARAFLKQLSELLTLEFKTASIFKITIQVFNPGKHFYI